MNKLFLITRKKIIFLLIVFFSIFLIKYFFFKKTTINNMRDFELFEQVVTTNPVNIEKMKELLDTIKKNNTNDSYSKLSSLIAANVFQEKLLFDEAKTELIWLSNIEKNNVFQHIAKLRLSNVFINIGEYDRALECLKHSPKSFEGLFDNSRGDVFFAQGNLSKAIENWKLSLNHMDKNDPLFKIIQLKIDSYN
ncbi:MAG: tetratricopeptide repeat protein [Candidatus Kinetoplastibacterium crithidii]|nr:MAG: tetratricopeptide repeat protein [Candidatus Kinetoplastibacterium crithidii]